MPVSRLDRLIGGHRDPIYLLGPWLNNWYGNISSVTETTGSKIYAVECTTTCIATSVKIDEETKEQLERLQAEIKLQTGKRVTQQKLLTRLVEHAIESKEQLIDSFRDERVPVSDAERSAFHERTFSSGVETREEDIDDILYG